MHDFISLPVDIKSLIFGYIQKPSELNALYRTCKDFHAILIPRVYRNVTISEEIDIAILCAFLNLENPGLRHIRHICIVPCSITKITSEYNMVLHMLANQLPKDILLSYMYVLFLSPQNCCHNAV